MRCYSYISILSIPITLLKWKDVIEYKLPFTRTSSEATLSGCVQYQCENVEARPTRSLRSAMSKNMRKSNLPTYNLNAYLTHSLLLHSMQVFSENCVSGMILNQRIISALILKQSSINILRLWICFLMLFLLIFTFYKYKR